LIILKASQGVSRVNSRAAATRQKCAEWIAVGDPVNEKGALQRKQADARTSVLYCSRVALLGFVHYGISAATWCRAGLTPFFRSGRQEADRVDRLREIELIVAGYGRE
jgi:hypothetical protein